MCLLQIKIIAVIKFNDSQTRYLIDYANLKHGLIKYQNDFISKDKLHKFYKHKFYGVPLLLPLGIKYFDYSNAIKFKVSENEIKNKIFNIDKSDYVGIKIFLNMVILSVQELKSKKNILNN